MALRFEVETNIEQVDKAYKAAARSIISQAKQMAQAQEQLSRALKKTGGSGESATAARVSSANTDAAAKADREATTAKRAKTKAVEDSEAAEIREEATIRKKINVVLQAIRALGDENKAYANS